MTEPITIRTTLTPDDYVKAIRYYQPRHRPTLLALGAFWLVGLAGLLLIVFNVIRGGPIICAAIPVFLLMPLYIFVITPVILRRNVRDDLKLLAETTWTFDEKGVKSTNKHQKTRTRWDDLRRALESKDYFLLPLTSSQRFFHIIPKRDLSEQDEEALRALLREKGLLK